MNNNKRIQYKTNIEKKRCTEGTPNERFYFACYYGNIDVAKEMIKKYPSVIESPSRVFTCFRNACVNGHLSIAKWIYSIPSFHLRRPESYLFIDVCNLQKNNLPLIKWLYDTFEIDITIDNHYVFRAAASPPSSLATPDLTQYLMSLNPYKYYIDENGAPNIRSDNDERWERRKNAVMMLYNNSVGKIPKEIWRRIIYYI